MSNTKSIKVFESIPVGSLQKFKGIAIPYPYVPGSGAEYQLFKEIYEDRISLGVVDSEAWGLVSTKYSLKTHVPLELFVNFALDKIKSGADCVFINPMILNEAIFANPWEQGILCGHKGMDLVVSSLQEMNIIQPNVLMSVDSFAFCNYFVGNIKFWERYFRFVDVILARLSNVASEDVRFKTIMNHGGYARNQALPMEPFVIERLFSSFVIKSRDLQFVSYPFKKEDYIFKAGFAIGSYCHRMSGIKAEVLRTGDRGLLEEWGSGRNFLLREPIFANLIIHCDDIDGRFFA